MQHYGDSADEHRAERDRGSRPVSRNARQAAAEVVGAIDEGLEDTTIEMASHLLEKQQATAAVAGPGAGSGPGFKADKAEGPGNKLNKTAREVGFAAPITSFLSEENSHALLAGAGASGAGNEMFAERNDFGGAGGPGGDGPPPPSRVV
jgi:hypothetical protein